MEALCIHIHTLLEWLFYLQRLKGIALSRCYWYNFVRIVLKKQLSKEVYGVSLFALNSRKYRFMMVTKKTLIYNVKPVKN